VFSRHGCEADVRLVFGKGIPDVERAVPLTDFGAPRADHYPGVIYVGIAPPPPHGEVIVAGPGRGYAGWFWIEGRWR